METDCIQYVQKCHRCQIHADGIKVPPNELNATSSPWSFAAWGMDIIGPVEPAASNRHRFILVANDYFTKWVKAVSYKAVTKKVVANFVRDCINRMSRAFNKRVKPRQFTPGQLVLKKIFRYQDETKGKFSPNWQVPYMVHRVLTGGALILAEMNGEVWSKLINSDAVKRYYV
ncbi:uncharacterized protein [Nicotiana sylvestris]|uniref:uncharacterized protein n=1 Tax=Nicotiana sylvestris TaxID=4096 RepID=UPI00388CBEBC